MAVNTFVQRKVSGDVLLDDTRGAHELLREETVPMSKVRAGLPPGPRRAWAAGALMLSVRFMAAEVLFL
jgi:hypothetical protein